MGQETKITLDDIRNTSEKYGVDIEISFGKHRMIVITNGNDVEAFKSHWDNTDYEKIIKIARSMHIKELERHEEIKEHLSKMNPDELPDNLFDKKCYSLNQKYHEIDDDELFSNKAPLKYQVLSVLAGCMDATHVENFSLDSTFFIRFMDEEPDISKEDIKLGINILVNEGYLNVR